MRIYLTIALLLMIGLVTALVALVGKDENMAFSCDYDDFFQREIESISSGESSKSSNLLQVEFANLRILLPERYTEVRSERGHSSYHGELHPDYDMRVRCGLDFWVSGMMGSGKVESCTFCSKESFNPKTWGGSISSSKSHLIFERESENGAQGLFLIAIISESDTNDEEIERYESGPSFGLLAYDDKEYIMTLDPNGYWLRSVYEQIENAFWPEDANGTN